MTKKYATTFYMASLLLPKEKRYASYAVYAICRISDEIVDSAGSRDRQEQLNRIKQNIASAYGGAEPDNTLLLAFRDSVMKYGIPKDYFDEILSGMEMDLKKTRYADFKETYEYCYKVAGVVGLIMLKIFGTQEKQARKYAVDLGIALQITNILRDIKEDWARGRFYLPQDELIKYKVSENDIALGRVSENFKTFMKLEIGRAREYYAVADIGIKLIDNKGSRIVASGIRRMYSGILDEIEKNNYDVFSTRAHVNNLRKAAGLAKIILTEK